MDEENIFVPFNPDEEYTTRIKNILTEYPDGSQILKEILQNSDDAQSSEQIFILDHNTYPAKKLFDPKLCRYQGPALLSANNAIFQEKDFKSLLNLANSAKMDECDKIGVMGIGFNSIFHITDVCSFISGSSYVFIDPHSRGYCEAPTGQRGTKANFVNHNLAMKYPDQFTPFSVALENNPLDEFYKGTIFRYPLRTDEDAAESKISTKKYQISQVREMLDTFFKIDNITCLLFLKYIEKISFYELKDGSKIPELIYEIKVINAKEIREKRMFLANNIKVKKQSEVTYQMELCQRSTKDETKIESKWQIISYIADNDERFNTNVRDCKFVPIVGLAARIDDVSENKGRLYCFLPLPEIEEDFSISINGCFAVSKNRRHLEVSTNEDLASDDVLLRKGLWNKYLFENVIPVAWKKFLSEVKNYVSFKQIYKLWPVPADRSSRNLDTKRCLWANLLQNVVNQLDVNLKVFRGPLDYLSVNDGYFADKTFKNSPDLLKLLTKLKFPVFIDIPESIVAKIEQSILRNHMNFITPEKVCEHLTVTYMHNDSHVDLNDTERLLLLEYVLRVKNVRELHGLPLIPVENKTFTTFKPRCHNEFYYIANKKEHMLIDKNFMGKIVDNTIGKELLTTLYNYAKNEKDINIQILSDVEFAKILNENIMFYNVENSESLQEIKVGIKKMEWIYKIWDHLQQNDRDLSCFLDVYLLLIDTNKNDNFITLRKLGAKQKCLCNSSQNQLYKDIIQILPLLGSTFINVNILKYEKLKSYVIEIDNVIAVLSSFEMHSSFPSNLVHADLTHDQRNKLTSYLGYLKRETCYTKAANVIKYIPLFTDVNSTNIINISLLIESKKDYFLLPKEDEQSYGCIISPSVFLETHTSEDLRFLLEEVLNVQRLKQEEYWKEHVVKYLNSQEINIIDEVIKELFKRWEIISNVREELKEIEFVTASSTKKQRPIDIFAPDEQLKVLFYSDEPFFPAEEYQTDYPKLLELGMKKLMTTNDLINRIKIYTSSNHKCKTHEKSLLLLKYIDSNYQDLNNSNDLHELWKKIRTETWIPVKNPSGQHTFSKATDCRDLLHAPFVSRKMPIVDCLIKNNDLRKILGWDDNIPIDTMLNQLFWLLKEFEMEKKKETEDDINKIYEYLNNTIDNNIDFLKDKLSKAKWILNDDEIYSTDTLVFTLPNCLMAFKWVLVSKHNIKYYQRLLEKLGVKKELGTSDCLEIFQNLNFRDKKFEVINILGYLSYKNEDLRGLLIPNMHNEMITHENILYNDINNNEELVNENSSILTHSEISKDLAKRLKIKNFSENFVINKIHTFDAEITALFKKTLEEFDRDEIVFREFLKNADDAGATQFCVILDDSDYRGSKSLIKEEMDCWQGPAIWLYNNKSFTEGDFKSIINVECNKKPDKIGKDGLGFVSCYNLTDLPQFVSSNRIVFFDPQRKFLPDNKCGSIFYFHDYSNEDQKHVFNIFKNQFEPYLNLNGNIFELDFNDKKFEGTLFRLPLRTESSEICNKLYKIDDIKEVLENIKKNITSELIFLQNIESIEVYRKKGRHENAKLMWKVEIIKNDPGRKSFGKKLQAFQIDIQFTEGDDLKYENWLVCSGEKTSGSNDEPLPSDTWGGVAAVISPSYEKQPQNGRYYSHISLDATGISINLHSNNWALSPDRISLDLNKKKTSQNTNILMKVLPQLHVKFYEEYLKRQHKVNFQVISKFWPFDSKISVEYGKKVLELVSQETHKIFWSPSKGGSYVSFKHCCFIDEKTPKNIIDFLNENEYPTVLLGPEYLKVFKFKSQQINPQLVRSILKSNRCVLCLSNLDLSFSLLHYILEDECYEDLEGIQLVPLFKNRFGTFSRHKNYCIASSKQFELFPNAGPDHFISAEILEIKGLYEIFTEYEFLIATNIKEFSEPSRDFLLKELNEVSELGWKPNSSLFPNQKWLNEIWSYILNSSLEPYQSFPLLEVYDSNNKHKLISLTNAKQKPLLVYSNCAKDKSIIKALTNIGIRFTTHEYNEKLEEYILTLKVENILSMIEVYQCQDKLSNDKEAKDILSQYFCQNLSLIHNVANKLKKLPIWPTHTIKDENIIYKSILDKNAYLIPTRPNSSQPFTFYPLRECQTYYFNTTYQSNMRELLESLSSKKQNKLLYIKEVIFSVISIPQNMQDGYLQFLIDISFDDDVIDEIKSYIKGLKVIPNKVFKLCYAKDLFDEDIPLFKCVYKESNLFLPSILQNNQKFKEVLKEIGFNRNVTPEIFIKCAEEIKACFEHENDLDKRKKIKNSAETAVCYFYKNHSKLNFSKSQWDKLSKIKFVPTSKKVLKVQYIYSCNYKNEKLQSFENLCLSKYKNLAWTQLSFFKKEPDEDVLKKYRDLGLPTIKTIIKHLKTIQKKVSKSDEWKPKDTNDSLLFEIIKDIYKELNSQCTINTKEFYSCFKFVPLFLNSTNPFDSQSWVIASQLDINIKNDYDSKRRPVAEYLRKYEKLLTLAGVSLVEISDWFKPKPIIYSSQQLSKSIIEFLKAGKKTKFNNVLFKVKNEEFYANSSILVCVAPYFQEIFFKQEEIEYKLEYEDIEPNSFNILLNWLYGEPFPQSIHCDGKVKYNDEFFQICKDLILASKNFRLKSLKDLIECEFAEYLKTNLDHNILIKVKKLAEEYNLDDLFEYCKLVEQEMNSKEQQFSTVINKTHAAEIASWIDDIM
ncbi:Sacsin [Gigaspora margarita]|nr:Sacsin [Gigaspora margarita]